MIPDLDKSKSEKKKFTAQNEAGSLDIKTDKKKKDDSPISDEGGH